MVMALEECADREYDFARQYSFRKAGVDKCLYLFRDGEQLLHSLGIDPTNVLDWVRDITKSMDFARLDEKSYYGHIKHGEVETAEGLVGICVKESIAKELAHAVLINRNLPKNRPYVARPLKVYFGTQNRDNLKEKGNFIVMEWIDGCNMSDFQYDPEAVLKNEAILRHMRKWEDHAQRTGRIKIHYGGQIEGFNVYEDIEFSDEAISERQREVDAIRERYAQLGIDVVKDHKRIETAYHKFIADVWKAAKVLDIEEYIDDESWHTFIQGLNKSRKPIFTIYDQYALTERIEEFERDRIRAEKRK